MVPGAAAALVAAADRWDAPAAQARPSSAVPAADDPGHGAEPLPVPAAPAPPSVVGSTAVVDPVPVPAAISGVSLGFADGALRSTCRPTTPACARSAAAAAALLEAPQG